MTAGAGPGRDPAGNTGFLVGREVAYSYDDSPCPLTGLVIARVADDSVTVAWGQEKFALHPSTTVEYLDELRPVDGPVGGGGGA